MGTIKSQDNEVIIIAALLQDVHTSRSEVFTVRALKLTTRKVESRYAREGMGFLTKSLPRLGKALDRALSSTDKLNLVGLGFKTRPNSELPIFLGELFELIFTNDGRVLPDPCVTSIKAVRQIAYCFYKYAIPYSPDLEQKVLDRFIETEADIALSNRQFGEIADLVACQPENYSRIKPEAVSRVIRLARRNLHRLFAGFNPWDIHPKHGPGAVAEKHTPWDKYRFDSISPRTLEMYPFDAFYTASLGHICDRPEVISDLRFEETSARVCLVPKDSRGPRLISAEPKAFQWIQQGLMRAIVGLVEQHPLTEGVVYFTDQSSNRFMALAGSRTARYATLDLKDASDRVTVGLVRLLFPEPLVQCLLASRSQFTTLPSGEKVKLEKFAPMGSAVCFPVLALTIWSILSAGLADATGKVPGFLVYGDDVIVPSEKSEDAMKWLETFGLAINRDKSCCQGFFRESCGLDAYRGVDVTPVKFKTVWTSSRCPNAFVSWVAYANLLHDRGWYGTYEKIVGGLLEIYKSIPLKELMINCPSIPYYPAEPSTIRQRVNPSLQKLEYRVLDVKSKPVIKEIDGWSMLLRFFAEATTDVPFPWNDTELEESNISSMAYDFGHESFAVRKYTRRQDVVLSWCWR
jgi:hypothetical protein